MDKTTNISVLDTFTKDNFQWRITRIEVKISKPDKWLITCQSDNLTATFIKGEFIKTWKLNK